MLRPWVELSAGGVAPLAEHPGLRCELLDLEGGLARAGRKQCAAVYVARNRDPRIQCWGVNVGVVWLGRDFPLVVKASEGLFELDRKAPRVEAEW